MGVIPDPEIPGQQHPHPDYQCVGKKQKIFCIPDPSMLLVFPNNAQIPRYLQTPRRSGPVLPNFGVDQYGGHLSDCP